MLPSQKRNANATEKKLYFDDKDSKEALQKKLDLSALRFMSSCAAVMLHCTAATAEMRGSFGKEYPSAAPQAGLCALALSAAAGDGPRGY